MPIQKLCTPLTWLRYVLLQWKLYTAQKKEEFATAQAIHHQELNKQMVKITRELNKSMWQADKSTLVEMVKEALHWPHERAAECSVGHLRLALRV